MATEPTGSAGTPAVTTPGQVGSPGIARVAATAVKAPTVGKPVATAGMKPSNAPAVAMKPPAAPAFKIESIATKTQFLKLLVYANYGVGKTFLMATASDVEEMCDVIMISAESGEMTIGTETEHNFQNIDTIKCTNWKQVAAIFEFLKLHVTYRDQLIAAETKDDSVKIAELEKKMRELEANFRQCPIDDIVVIKRYRTLIIDSLTEVNAYIMMQLLGINNATRLDVETAKAEWAEYGKSGDMMMRAIRNFRDLPMHVLFSAARNSKENEEKRERFMPDMIGSMSRKVQGFMDIVGYYTASAPDDKNNITRTLWVQPQGKFDAKCRFSNFKGTHFVNPTIRKILTTVGLIAVPVVEKKAEPAAASTSTAST